MWIILVIDAEKNDMLWIKTVDQISFRNSP